MNWNCYLTIFKAEAPVHIGYKQIGILKTTRYFITGKVIWGTITANLTRALFGSPDSNTYQAVGNFVKENIKTTYFYPAVKEENGIDVKNLTDYCVNIEDGKFGVFLPEYKDRGLYFGKFSKEKFEQIFVSSFVSTAIEPSTKTTEEGSLHEFEFINNKVKINNKTLNVYWIGYIFVKEKVKNEKVEIEKCEERDIILKAVGGKDSKSFKKDILNFAHVGGERNYGLGKLKLEIMQKTNDKIFGKFDFELSNEYPVIKSLITKNSNHDGVLAIAHTDLNGLKLKLGEIEPLVGLEWSEAGAGQNVSKARVCIVPGSKLKGEYDLALGEYGILKKD